MTRGGKWEKLGQERRKAIVPRGLFQRSTGRSEVGCAVQQKRWSTSWMKRRHSGQNSSSTCWRRYLVLEALAPPTTKLTESGAVLDIQRRFQTEIDSRRDDAQDSVWRLGPDPPSRDRSMDALAGEGVVEIRDIMIR